MTAYKAKIWTGSQWDDIAQSYPAGTIYGPNILHNGAFNIWQRGTSTIFSSQQYLADRWAPPHYQQANLQRTTISGSGDVPPTIYGIRVGSATTAQNSNGTRGALAQQIESINVYPLRGKTVTLSFYVRFSAATQTSAVGVWLATIGADTAVDPAMGTNGFGTNVATLSINNGSFNTNWVKYKITGTVPTDASMLRVDFRWAYLFSTASAYTDWYEISCVQLEVGSTPTNFQFKDYGTELRECQRYYEQSYNIGIVPGTAVSEGMTIGSITTNSVGDAVMPLKFATTKRTSSYTMTFYNVDTSNTNTWSYTRNGIGWSTIAPSSYWKGNAGCGIVLNAGAGYVPVYMYGHWTCSADL